MRFSCGDTLILPTEISDQSSISARRQMSQAVSRSLAEQGHGTSSRNLHGRNCQKCIHIPAECQTAFAIMIHENPYSLLDTQLFPM